MSKISKTSQYIFKILAFAILAIVLTNSVRAEQITGVEGNADDDGSTTQLWEDTITSIRSLTKLVRSTKTIKSCSEEECIDRESTLQVSLVVIDNGPSTDVSSPAVLYLTMYNSVEETGVAKSMHLIEDIVELHSTKRVSAGVYEVEYQAFRIEEECSLPVIRARIDARELSSKVRAAKKIDFLQDFAYTDAIDVAYEVLSCGK